MSTYANFYIEVRNKETNKWEAVLPYYKFKSHKIENYTDAEVPIMVDAVPDTTTSNNEKLSRMSYIWRQGHIRDMFTHSLDKCELADRGLPDDLSDEVKAIFKKWEDKLEKKKTDYLEKYGEEMVWGCKWWYSESYATLSELDDQLEKELNKWKQDLKDAFREKYENEDVKKKLDEILGILKKDGGITKKHEDEEEYWDYTEELLDDTLYDVMQLSSFVSLVHEFSNSLTEGYNSEDDVRIIVFCD